MYVFLSPLASCTLLVIQTDVYLKAASGLEKLKMGDSPAKKLDFQSVDKENVKDDAAVHAPVVDDVELKKVHTDVVEKGQRLLWHLE